MMIFPYTRISLNRKNCRGLGFFLQALVSTPSPTSTRPDTEHFSGDSETERLTRHCKRLTGGPEALFHIRDPPCVGRGVDCNTIEIQLAHYKVNVVNVMSGQMI